MSIRRTAVLGVATLAAAAAVLAAQPAYAAGSTDVLSWGGVNPDGTNVATTDTLTGNLASGTTSTFKFTSGSTTVTITCTAAASTATATSNPTAPGTAAMSISQLTFSGCTLTGLSGITVSSITIKSGTTAVANITDSPEDLNITSLNEAVVLHSGLGNITCDYGTTSAVTDIQGAIVNPDSTGANGTITFTSQPVGLISGTSVCGASGSQGTFNATLGAFSDGSGTGSDVAVYDN
jgi:hypothetical protein